MKTGEDMEFLSFTYRNAEMFAPRPLDHFRQGGEEREPYFNGADRRLSYQKYAKARAAEGSNRRITQFSGLLRRQKIKFHLPATGAPFSEPYKSREASEGLVLTETRQGRLTP